MRTWTEALFWHSDCEKRKTGPSSAPMPTSTPGPSDPTRNPAAKPKPKPKQGKTKKGNGTDGTTTDEKADRIQIKKFEADLHKITSSFGQLTVADTSNEFRTFWSNAHAELKKIAASIKDKKKSAKRRTRMDNPSEAFIGISEQATILTNIAKDLASNNPSLGSLTHMERATDEFGVSFGEPCWIKKAKADFV